MTKRADKLKFKSTGKPRIVSSLFKHDGWKSYRFDAYGEEEKPVGRLDINIPQHPKHSASWQFYLFDSSDRSKAIIYESPIPYPPKKKKELFKKVKKRVREWFEIGDIGDRQPIPLDQTRFNR